MAEKIKSRKDGTDADKRTTPKIARKSKKKKLIDDKEGESPAIRYPSETFLPPLPVNSTSVIKVKFAEMFFEFTSLSYRLHQ